MLINLAIPVKSCHPSSWLYIFANNGVKFFIDLENTKIDTKKEIVNIWEKQIRPDDSIIIGLHSVHYKENLYKVMQVTKYGPNGAILYSVSGHDVATFIKPGSAWEFIVNRVLEIKGIKYR